MKSARWWIKRGVRIIDMIVGLSNSFSFVAEQTTPRPNVSPSLIHPCCLTHYMLQLNRESPIFDFVFE